MVQRKVGKKLVLFMFPALFISCSTVEQFRVVDNSVNQGNFPESVTLLESHRQSLYTNRDTILYYLDKGMLSHYAGMYADSSELLEAGEAAIVAAFTKSITQGIASYMINDNMLDYPGEDYEDIYVNIFGALNYYHRGMIEDAMVEIRRMNEKLVYLATRYNVMISDLQQMAINSGNDVPAAPNATSNFNDSALARYLGMLFYRSTNRPDDARIDSQYLMTAFANAPNLYPHPVPSSIAGELSVTPGLARFNIIAFSGLSPIKKESVIRIPLPGMRWAKIALPEMESRQSEISRIEIIFNSGDRVALELLEDIDAIARETFQLRKGVIYTKTIIRAMTKGVSSSVLNAASNETEGSTSAILGILSLVAQAAAEVTEQADLRISRYFPARAWVAGIDLPPGLYSFDVIYYSRSGKPVFKDRRDNVMIRERNLNLFESFCLQ
jgi:hypothetical protein